MVLYNKIIFNQGLIYEKTKRYQILPMLFKYKLCDCLMQLIQLFEAILPRCVQTIKILIWTNKYKPFEKHYFLVDQMLQNSNEIILCVQRNNYFDSTNYLYIQRNNYLYIQRNNYLYIQRNNYLHIQRNNYLYIQPNNNLYIQPNNNLYIQRIIYIFNEIIILIQPNSH